MAGRFSRAWLYRDDLRPVAEITDAGLFSHFVYANSESGAPDFMLRAGVPFRFVKDQLGSVRLVVNALTGVVAEALDYDEFGNVTRDTLPGFQPFGFAGGLYDADTGLVRFGARDYDAFRDRYPALLDDRFQARELTQNRSDGGTVRSAWSAPFVPRRHQRPSLITKLVGRSEYLELANTVDTDAPAIPRRNAGPTMPRTKPQIDVTATSRMKRVSSVPQMARSRIPASVTASLRAVTALAHSRTNATISSCPFCSQQVATVGPSALR